MTRRRGDKCLRCLTAAETETRFRVLAATETETRFRVLAETETETRFRVLAETETRFCFLGLMTMAAVSAHGGGEGMGT